MRVECPIRRSAISRPTAVALRTHSHALTYHELEAQIAAVQKYLSDCGIARGNRVAILADNSAEFIILLWALMRAGAIAVPLNTRLDQQTLTKQLASAGVAWLLHDERFQTKATDLKSAAIVTGSLPEFSGEAIAFTNDPLPLEGDDIFAICFTSGSSGAPKGVQLSVDNFIVNALGSNENIRLTEADCWHLALPLCHVGGLGILFRAFLSAASVFVDNRFDAAKLNKLIDSASVSHLSLVPTMLHDLLLSRGIRSFPQSVQAVLLGGASLPATLLEAIKNLGIPAVMSYGLTEAASQVTATTPGEDSSRLATGGRLLPGREIRIVSADGTLAPTNTAGEIRVRGAVLFKGYINEAASPTDPDGWFATGDLGYFDVEGYLHVVGRSDRMIISGGENIRPEEIERAAMNLPAVRGAACVARPDPRWGWRPVLFVELEPGASTRMTQLRATLQAYLARFKLPDRIVILDQLPKTAIGKIDLASLAENAASLKSAEED